MEGGGRSVAVERVSVIVGGTGDGQGSNKILIPLSTSTTSTETGRRKHI